MKKKIAVILFLLALCLWPLTAQATEGEEYQTQEESGELVPQETETADEGEEIRPVFYQTSPEGGAVGLQKVDGRLYLFLPASADLTQLTLRFDGESAALASATRQIPVTSGQPFSLLSLFPTGVSDGQWPVTVKWGAESLEFTIMRSENLRALFLTSGDPEQDRAWVEQSKENKAKDLSLLLLDADGRVIHSGQVKTLRGRGNSSWGDPKKPYQFKLDKKADLLETGDPAEAEKTWVLLNNYCDPSLMHNLLTFALGEELGLPYTPHCAQVDLYYDGEYRGTYLLSEKTEVGSGRVAVDDLEDTIEKANPDGLDFDALPTQQGVSEIDTVYQYVTGAALPEDYSGGYLLEIDYEPRAKQETSWFATRQEAYIVSKSPEYLPEEALLYIRDLYQQFEDAVYNGGVDPATGKDYRELIDVRSLAVTYLLQELSENIDAYQSSTFFYKPRGEEKLYAGPLWDFDQGYGVAYTNPPGDTFVAGGLYLANALLTIPSFQEAVKEAEQELQPLVGQVALSANPAAQSGGLLSLLGWAEELRGSERMNAVLWPLSAPEPYAQAVSTLRTRLAARNLWLAKQVESWDGSRPKGLGYFIDVPSWRWYADAVNDMTERGYFSGVTANYFVPDIPLSRAMMVTLLYRMAGEPPVTGQQVFPDVPPASWYGPAVEWAKEEGLARGNNYGEFNPNVPISRQELITFLHRLMGEPASDTDLTTFYDWYEIKGYARAAMSWGVETGLLRGGELGDLAPLQHATRAQSALILQRYLDLEPQEALEPQEPEETDETGPEEGTPTPQESGGETDPPEDGSPLSAESGDGETDGQEVGPDETDAAGAEAD